MAFQFDKRTISAFDSARQIRIRASTKFYDDTDRYYFTYKGPDSEFEFSAAELGEIRTVLIKGYPIEKRVATATLILEPSLKTGFAQVSAGQLSNPEAYEALKRDVEEAMFAIGTWGGSYLSTVPDYKVGFIQTISDALR